MDGRSICGSSTCTVEDNLVARKHLTQTRILQRVAKVHPGHRHRRSGPDDHRRVRQWGVSLLASAGVVGIIAGLALQPVLTNLVAGIQIALTQPIRIDDAVIVEGEWGKVEEITSTYVVVKLWDWRRMVLPLSYFITKPFQNWTRENARLIGTAMLYVDYAAPIDRLRAELRADRARLAALGRRRVRCCRSPTSPSASCRSAAWPARARRPVAFDLRCEIREKMMAFMRDECPEALPQGTFVTTSLSRWERA